MPKDSSHRKLDIESLNDRIDHTAEIVGGHPKANPRSEKRDKTIVRLFPWFLVACIIISLTLIIHNRDYTSAWKIIDDICYGFVIGFTAIGIWSIAYLDSGPFPLWFLAGFVMMTGAIMWFYVTGAGSMLILRGASSLKPFIPGDVEDVTLFIDLLLSIFLLLLSSIGVLTTISAMLRKFMPGVLLSIEKSAKKGERGKAADFFMVPGIIDVESVEMEPTVDSHVFDLRSFLELSINVFSLGMVICSILFLNPIVLESVPKYSAIRIMILLSVFLPSLVIPWQSVRSTGAKVLSSAPRPYYLWTGAKTRLFTGSATLGVFFLLFIISVYLGNDVGNILGYYVQYIIPLAAISVLAGLLYANCIAKNLRDSICLRFEKKKTDFEASQSDRSLNPVIYG